MGLFDDNDPFESIFEEFFGGSRGGRKRREQFIRGEDEDRTVDFIETIKDIYLLFEVKGYNEKEIFIAVNGGQLEINARKSSKEDVQSYLHQKLKQGLTIKKKLPEFVDAKKMRYTVRNGILEIAFEKTKGGKK